MSIYTSTGTVKIRWPWTTSDKAEVLFVPDGDHSIRYDGSSYAVFVDACEKAMVDACEKAAVDACEKAVVKACEKAAVKACRNAVKACAGAGDTCKKEVDKAKAAVVEAFEKAAQACAGADDACKEAFDAFEKAAKAFEKAAKACAGADDACKKAVDDAWKVFDVCKTVFGACKGVLDACKEADRAPAFVSKFDSKKSKFVRLKTKLANNSGQLLSTARYEALARAAATQCKVKVDVKTVNGGLELINVTIPSP